MVNEKKSLAGKFTHLELYAALHKEFEAQARSSEFYESFAGHGRKVASRNESAAQRRLRISAISLGFMKLGK